MERPYKDEGRLLVEVSRRQLVISCILFHGRAHHYLPLPPKHIQKQPNPKEKLGRNPLRRIGTEEQRCEVVDKLSNIILLFYIIESIKT